MQTRSNPSPWWKKTVIYQMYPRSFKDTTGNGIGDLNGIIAKLDYLKDLGIETIWLSPVYPSPQKDFGYGISDFRGVDPLFGDFSILKKLIEGVHERGMKIILDITLNHTSDDHPWFLESRSSRNSIKRGWYLWRDGRKPGGKKPPNNWRAMTGGTGWRYDPETDQWYFARYFSFHPELDFRNPAVQKEILDILRFWFDNGIDGFRLDVIDNLFVDAGFRDNPFTWKLFSMETGEFFFRSNEMTNHLPETIEFMRTLRRLAEEYKDKNGGTSEKIFVGEASGHLEVLQKYCGSYIAGENGVNELVDDGINLVFIFKYMNVPMKAKKFREMIEDLERYFPEPLIPTIVFSNHDRMRRISKIGNDVSKAKLNCAFQMTTRGVPVVYYGEEIGMEQASIPIKQSLDPLTERFKTYPQWLFNFIKRFFKESLNRDECRTPMQWDDSENAGFTGEGITPWLPVQSSSKTRNVKVESKKDADSILNCYKRFIQARNTTGALNIGSISLPGTRLPRNVLYFQRVLEFSGKFLQIAHVLLNFKNKSIKIKNPCPDAIFLVSTTLQTKPDQFPSSQIMLKPHEGLVLIEKRKR
ncbi:MAG: alpha-amylase family glycosyl hydrolase [Promethearchaeota archaeon]